MKRAALATLCALMLAGCSSGGDDSPSQTTPSVANTPQAGLDTTSKAPPSSAQPSGPSVIKKTIGQEGGIGCKSGQANCADLADFVVTDISAPSGCSLEPAAGKKFLHVAGSVSLAPTIDQDIREYVGRLLNVSGWKIIGADGYTSTNLSIATSCKYEAGPFYDTVQPGSKQRGDIVFEVPLDAQTLRLAPQASEGEWEWAIP